MAEFKIDSVAQQMPAETATRESQPTVRKDPSLSGSESEDGVSGPAAPRILLEVLSPSGTRFIFILVYGAFAIALWQNEVSQLSVASSKSARSQVEKGNQTLTWLAEVENLGEVFGTVSVTARFPNGTNATDDEVTEEVGYKILVEASKSKHVRSSNPTWKSVLRRTKETAVVKWNQDEPRWRVEDDVDDDEWAILSAQLASWYQVRVFSCCMKIENTLVCPEHGSSAISKSGPFI